MTGDILIVDDEADIRGLISGILEDEGFQTRTAGGDVEALAAVDRRVPTMVVLDIWLRGSKLDGMAILEVLRRDYPELPVAMISGHGNIETAVQAIKLGAYDFIEKPFEADRLILMINRAVEAARLRQENKELRLRAGPETQIIGESGAINTLRRNIRKVASTNSRVLIEGAAGTGKEVAARAIHASSVRNQGPFIVLNAAMMAPERVEEELFGIEANGATSRRIGMFERAHGGTLFLDEVGDMPFETQGKVLRVLVDQHFHRVGGDQPVDVDVRVICSTTRNLNALIEEGQFRTDLFHRLNVVPIRVPPLTERREDIPLLVTHFMERSTQTLGLPARIVTTDAMTSLQGHAWPGNVRQLRNIVERLVIMAPDACEKIHLDMLPAEICSPMAAPVQLHREEEIMGLALRDAREMFERQYLLAQIGRFGGNISRTAVFIGMERSALHRKMKSLGISARTPSAAAE